MTAAPSPVIPTVINILATLRTRQYAIERFLYRISKSKHAQSVVLKGALLLKTIGIPRARPTIDIDMLRKGKADQASLIALVKDCATLDVEQDGSFLDNSVVAEEITKDSEYKGTPYDVWICSSHLDFKADTLLKAIEATFKNRDTPVPAEEFDAFTTRFVDEHQVQWNAFAKKIGEDGLRDEFARIVEDLRPFAMPLFRSLATSEKLPDWWIAKKGWAHHS